VVRHRRAVLEARIIFVDTETSNWTWDPVRKQYFWHRFFSHQPDLNYDNPAVQEAMIDVLKFWLDMGIDGFRLDAVPYLFERVGTNGENLPETHDFLKRVRKEVDELYPDRVMLCEANQWPEDVVEYFGEDGDECQMAFHFPLMPRLFMAVRRESRYPISEILANTPAIPKSCQWGIFLRNHDELTLEMVTDDERDYMYKEYAKDPRMKSNVGIARRLAPLLENSRDQIELFTGLLLSLPGSPVLYYGDEIGMGDNIYLGDRDGVRTPMQWNADRNAGFSTADPQQLYLPAILDPVYGYQALNVEAQMRSSSSLLNWTRKMLGRPQAAPGVRHGQLRRAGHQQPVRAGLRPRVRRRQGAVRQQPVPLPPAGGARPAPLRGHGPRRAHRPRPLPAGGRAALPALAPRPRLHVVRPAARGGPVTGTTTSGISDALLSWLPQQRWYGAKTTGVRAVQVEQEERLPGDADVRHCLLAVTDEHDHTERYQLLIGYTDGELEQRLKAGHIGEVDGRQAYDAVHDPAATGALLRLLAGGGSLGALRSSNADSLHTDLPSRVIGAEQSNTSVVYGEEYILKLFRPRAARDQPRPRDQPRAGRRRQPPSRPAAGLARG
jgi:hypothetical protein